MASIETQIFPILRNFIPLINSPNNLVKIAVAVSGGVDSMALINLLKNYKKTHDQHDNLKIVGLTVNHNLRSESTIEAKEVNNELINNINVDGEILDLTDLNPTENGKIEEMARIKRYEIIQKYCIDNKINKIFLGHHLDDQLETFLIRLKNNSTLFGLSAMNYHSKYPLKNLYYPNHFQSNIDNLSIIRPLLNLTKNDLYEYCTKNQIKWFEDPTNKDDGLTLRNWIRKHIINENAVTDSFIPPMLSKGQLINSLSQVKTLNHIIENNVKLMHSELKNSNCLQFDPQRLSLSIKFQDSFLNKFMNIEINKFLYQLIEQVSPNSAYHYGYTRIDNKDATITSKDDSFSLAETIKSMLQESSPSETLKFNKLNCNFTLTKSQNEDGSQEINVIIARETPTKFELPNLIKPVSITHDSENWIYYDNKAWFQFKLNSLNGLDHSLDQNQFDAVKAQFGEQKESVALPTRSFKPMKYFYLDVYNPKRHANLLPSDLQIDFKKSDLQNVPILLNTNVNPANHPDELVYPMEPSTDMIKDVSFVCFPTFNIVSQDFKSVLDYRYVPKEASL